MAQSSGALVQCEASRGRSLQRLGQHGDVRSGGGLGEDVLVAEWH